MKLKLYLAIILLLAFVEVISTKIFEERCKRVKHFRRNRSYWYEYEGYVENGIKGTSDKAAKMRISASIWIDYINDCEYSLQMKDVKLEESIGNKNGFILSQRSSEAAKALQKYPLQFVMEYGLITQIRPSLKERQKDILNIKRGILSSLQIEWSKTREKAETTVSGICDVIYKISKNKDGARNISKTTDLASCKERTMVHSNIESEQYIKTSSIYEENSSCNYVLKKKNQIFKAECEEYYLVKPFSSSVGAGSYSKIKQIFRLRKAKKVSKKPRQYPEYYTTSLLFDHKHEEDGKSTDLTAVTKMLTDIVKTSSRKTQPGSANHFAELVFSLRKMEERGLGTVLGGLSTCFNSPSCNREMVEAYWSYFLEALAQCGSTSCVNLIANLIITNKLAPNMADDLISSLNFIQEPSTAMLNTIMGIHKATSNPTALLSLGTLMHKLCKHRPDECLGNGPIANVVKNAEYYLMRLLGNECSTKNLEKSKQMYYALKAIGNAGRPVRINNIILDCVRHAAHMNTSIAALHALNRMPLDNSLMEFLREILGDRNMDIEKRMESFVMLMKNPSKSDILLAIDMVNDPEEAKQFRSFVYSYLKAAISNKAPEKKKLTKLFQDTLLLKNMSDFNPTASRFSKVFEKSMFLDMPGIGGSATGKLLFHPESYIPRTIRVGLNGQALGHAVNIMEINARMEGLEKEISKHFVGDGLMSKSFLKDAFQIPNLEPRDQAKDRNRRSAIQEEFDNKLEDLDNKVNLKEPSPQLALSIKIFGNEIKMLSLKDIPLLNDEMDNMNFIHALYSLTKGKSKTFRRNLVFLEGIYIVPTIVGLPLSFEMNGSAIVSVNVEGKISAKNLVFGPKLLTLKGSILPSVSTEISGKVTVDGFFSKAGFRFNARTHASASIGGEIKYEEGKEFEVNIDAPEEPVDLFSYNHEMFHVVGSQEVEIQGSKRRTNLNICTDELYQSTAIFGVDVCAAMSFPVAYQNLDAPYYPLSGPANVVFSLKRTDVSLSKYHLSILKHNDLYRIKFGTPGAQNERWNMVNLGITANSQKGVIGATFGDSKRGLILRYQYDNKTHGVQATLTSNITQDEITISGSYFNKTDPATLDLKMGLEFDMFSNSISLNHRLLFVDTYEYWGFDWLVDYGKEPINAELKVAYNPQTVFFKFQYGLRNFAVQLQPSFPVIILDLGISWRPVVCNLTLNLDLKTPVVAVTANTTAHSYAGRIGWIKGNKQQELSLNFRRDRENYKWISSANYENDDKILESYLLGNGKKYGAILVLRQSEISLNFHGFPGRLQAGLSRDLHSKGVVLKGNFGRHSGTLKLHLKDIPSDGVRSVCLTSTTTTAFNMNLCLDLVSKAEMKALKMRLESPQDKLSTSLSFKSPAGSMSARELKKEFMGIDCQVNGRTVFEVNSISDVLAQSPAKRRLSSLSMEATVQNVYFDFKMPIGDPKNGRVQAPAWLLFRRTLTDGEQTFEIRQNTTAVSNAMKKELTIATTYQYSQMSKSNLLFVFYSDKQKWDFNKEDHKILREYASIYNNAVSYNIQALNITSGIYTWDILAKIANLSDTIRTPGLLVVKDRLKTVKPLVQLNGKIEKMHRGTRAYYPKVITAEILGNKVGFAADMKNNSSKLSVHLSSGVKLDIRLNFASGKKYIFEADYRNATWDMKTVILTITKDSKMGSWQVKIQHPALRMLIGSLRKKYNYRKQKIREELLKKLSGTMIKGKVNAQMRNELLRDAGFLFGLNYIKANLSTLFGHIDNKWRGVLKTIVQKQIKDSMKMGLERAAIEVKGNLSSNIREIVEKLSSDVSRMVTEIMLFKTDAAMQHGKEIGLKLKKYAKDFIHGKDFEKIIRNAIDRSLRKQNVSSESTERIMKIFNRGFKSVIRNPREIFPFYKNLSKAIIKEMLQKQRNQMKIGLERISKLFMSHVSKSADVETRSELYALFSKIQKILINDRLDGSETLWQTLKKLMTAFEKVRITEDDSRKIAVGLLEQGLQNAGIPGQISSSVIQFTKDLNYAGFYFNLMRYCMQAANLTDSVYQGLAYKLYKNDVKGLIEIASLAITDTKLPEQVKLVFRNYLRSFDTNGLMVGLLDIGLGKVSGSAKLAASLGKHLANRNITELARELTRFGISKLNLPSETKRALHEVAFGPINRSFLQRITHVLSIALNNSDTWNNVLHSLNTHKNMANFLKTFFKEILSELKLAPEAEALLSKFTDDFNISGLLKKATLKATGHLFNAINMSNGNDTFDITKMKILSYMHQGLNMIPDLWQPRLSPIFQLLMQEIRKIRPEDLAKNTTKILFEIGENVFKVVHDYVSNNLAADLEKDSKAAINALMGKMRLGNVSFADLFERLKTDFNDRLMFGLRLASQIFPEQVQQYRKKYTKGNAFLYDKIYSDFLKTNISSQHHVNMLENMFSKLASKILMEVTNATGGFSTGTGFLNMLKFVRGLNFTDGNSIIKSYERMKNMKYTKWSVQALHQHLKAALRRIGQWNVGNQTIDESMTPLVHSFRTILPKIIATNENLKRLSEKSFEDAFRALNVTQIQVRDAIMKSSVKLKQGFQKWRKILTFVSDLTIPVMSNIPRIFGSSQRNSGKNPMDFVLLKALLAPADRLGLLQDIQKLIEKTDDTSTDESLQVILTKMSKAFELIAQNMVAKRINFSKEVLLELQVKATEILSAIDSFLNHKAEQPLYKLINKAGKHGYGYLKSSIMNSTLGQRIKEEMMPLYNVTGMKESIKLQLRNISSSVKKAFESLDQKSLKKWAQQNVPDVINKASLQTTKAFVQYLRLLDKTRSLLVKNKFLRNPAGFMRDIPRRTMHLLALRMKESKPRIMAWFVAVENAFRSKFFEARELYGSYIKKMQEFIGKAQSQLNSLDYFASILKIAKDYNWQKYPFYNYTTQLADKIKSADELLAKRMEILRKSGSLEVVLSKMTNDTKDWLNELRSILSKDVFNLTHAIKNGLNKLESHEQTMSQFNDMLDKNLSNILVDVEKLAKNTTDLLVSMLEDTSRKIGPARDAILKKILNSLKRIQLNATRLKEETMKYISLLDDSSIVINIPKLPNSISKLFHPRRIRFDDAGNRFGGAGKSSPQNRKSSSHGSSSSSGYRPSSYGSGFASGSQSSTYGSSSASGKRSLLHSSKATSDVHLTTYVSGTSEDDPRVTSASVAERKPDYLPLENFNGMQKIYYKPFLEQGFYKAEHALNSFTGLLTNVTTDYYESREKLDARLDKLAVNLYNRQVLVPLQRLAVAASIPAPAESLQSLGKGEGVWQKCTKMFMPSAGSATLYGNHLFTFDGNYVFIPELKRAKRKCIYLLARDFKDGNFTLLYDLGRLILKTKDSKVYFNRKGMVEIMDLSKASVRRITDLPAQVGSIIVKKFDQVVKLESLAGFTLFCHMDIFLCNFTVSGMYHNKTLGLFGTNNMEYADDLRLPDGSLAVDIVEFIKSWELSDDNSCKSISNEDFIPTCKRQSSSRCRSLFKDKSSMFSRAFDNVNPAPYRLACEHETSKCLSSRRSPVNHCATAAAYVNMALQTGVQIKHPAECGFCLGASGKPLSFGRMEYHKDLRSVDMVLIIRDSKAMKRALKNLIIVMQKVDSYLKSTRIDPRYWLVGFDGIGYRMAPYIQTGNSLVSGNINRLISALNNLEYKNTRKIVSGLDAIRFASQLDMRASSTKIFIILDSVAVYSGALKEMMDTNNLIMSKEIILNAINKYKFKRNIIGKDSFNKRYHLKIPKGERLRNLAFHTADDYMPIVKESRGAVLTVKALMSSNEKWMKAFPRSLNEVLHNQIKFDKKHCRTCRCMLNKEGRGVLSCNRAEGHYNC